MTPPRRYREIGSLVLVLALVLSGCVTVGPDYTAPETPTPAAWNAKLVAGVSVAQPDEATLLHWWTEFDDPALSDLIERAVAGNLDLRQAQARVREARARRGFASADRFPTLGAAASGTKARASEEASSGLSTELYAAGFDASWELDVFGGKRRALEAADATLQASREDLRDVLVSLLAEVALNYVELRSFQARLAIAEASLATQADTYDITYWRAEAGLTTQLDVERARFNLEQTRALVPMLRSGTEQAANRLAVLLGQAPGSLGDALGVPRAIPVAPVGIAVGVPADVLRRRPDVRRAERQLAAQTAQVGVATAARYPDFTLLGSVGLEALSTARLLTSTALASSIGASAGWTIFDAGRLRQNVEVQNALQEQALIAYESAVFVALRDVENALVAYGEEQARRDALAVAARAAGTAADLAGQQYVSGLVDFQVVLDAQRSALVLQELLATSEAEVASNLVRLYKALGGGWTSLASEIPEIQGAPPS